MVRFWDKFGIWAGVYLFLLYLSPTPSSADDSITAVFLHLFLLLNLTLNVAVFYRFLLSRWAWLRYWGPIVSRWVARWLAYTVIGCVAGGLVFSIFGLILAPVVAIIATIYHIIEDVQASRAPRRA